MKFVFLQVPLPDDMHQRLRRRAHQLKRRPADLASIWLAEAIQRQTPEPTAARDAADQLDLFGDDTTEQSHYKEGL